MKQRSRDRAFVLGAYIPHGGALMAYHVGLILQSDFGFQAVAVTIATETPEVSAFDYPVALPAMSLGDMEQTVNRNDVIVVNPSFSNRWLGWRLPGFKLSYVQHFNSFALLDMKLDHYVAVSEFVANFLRTTYDLEVRVIPPFIPLERLAAPRPWADRSEDVISIRKGHPALWDLSFRRLREIVSREAPEIKFAPTLGTAGDRGPWLPMPQDRYFAKLAEARYFLTLSPAEGFGLMPLEAMALGAVVIGYDGYGGRDYMRSGENCEVEPYPNIERVAARLIDIVRSPDRAARLSKQAQKTAQAYSWDLFRAAWIEELKKVLGRPAA